MKILFKNFQSRTDRGSYILHATLVTGTYESSLYTVEMLLDCIQMGRQFSPTVLEALEAATLAAITREKLQLYS